MTRYQRFFPFLAWPRPTRELLTGEAWAGLTVALMVIPQGVAYAALAGMPLVTGIYASLLPALVAVLWSASPRLSVGPTALTALLTGLSLTGLATPGSAEWVNLAVWMTLLSGLLQGALGVAGFGWLLNVVSSPVLMGFTQAAALLILASQLPALVGASGLGQGLWAWLQHPQWHAPSAAFGLGSLATLVLAKRFVPHWPAVVMVMGATSALSYFTGFENAGGQVVGVLASGLPALYVPTLLPLGTLGQLLVPVLVITLVSFLETASSAKVDNQRSGQRWNKNQDLMGQALAKLASGLCGAFPTSSSFSRSALTLYAGAKTGWATVFSVLMVLLALLFLMPLLHYVPLSVLASVVIAAIVSLIRPRSFVALWNVSRVEAVTAASTWVITLMTAPRLYWGVIAGLLMSLSDFLYQRLHPRVIEVGLHPDGSLRDRHLWHLPPLAPHLYALRMDAELDFASASGLEEAITNHLGAHPGVRHVCLFAQPINRIDATGVEMFGQLMQSLRERGITLHISGIKLPVEKVLQRAGHLKAHARLRLYRNDIEALGALHALAEDPSDIAGAAI